MSNPFDKSSTNPFDESTTMTDDEHDDKETPLLPSSEHSKSEKKSTLSDLGKGQDDETRVEGAQTAVSKPDDKAGSRFFCYLCDSRVALVIANVLSLVLFFSGFIALIAPGHIKLDGQNAVAMIFSFFFTLLVLYCAFKWNPTGIAVALLWEFFVITFGIVGATSFSRTAEWSEEPKSTQQGTEAFVVIALIWKFAVLYTEMVYLYELKRGILTPEGSSKVFRTEDHNHSGEKGETV